MILYIWKKLNKNYLKIIIKNKVFDSGNTFTEKKKNSLFDDIKNIFGNLFTIGTTPSEK